MEQEPVYRVQRIATNDAACRAFDNFLRRLVGLPVKRTAKQVEIAVLAKYGLGPEFATWR